MTLTATHGTTTPVGEVPVIEADGLIKHYPVRRGLLGGQALVRALDGVSFRLAAGRTLAVVGESGCGKSTLARSVTLIEPPTAGTLTFAGTSYDAADRRRHRALRQSVQMVFQDPYGSLNPRKTVGSILGEPLVINTRLNRVERRDRTQAMMARVGLRPDQIDRYPHMFSGGQRQRIAIARALMLNPKLVVADEPVSALDVSIQAQVLNLMMDLQDEFRLAYLLISHDLSVVRLIADDIIVMYLGRPVEQGAARAIFETPRHPYTKTLLAATPRIDPADRTERLAPKGELPSPLAPPPGCHFHRRCPFATDRCSAEVPRLRPLDGGPLDEHQVACHHAEGLSPTP